MKRLPVEHCENCGAAFTVGEWPFCPHGEAYKTKGFEPYFDVALGVQVNTPGDRNKALRPRWENDHIVHLQPRDKPASYYRELNERRRERAERRDG